MRKKKSLLKKINGAHRLYRLASAMDYKLDTKVDLLPVGLNLTRMLISLQFYLQTTLLLVYAIPHYYYLIWPRLFDLPVDL